LLEEYPRSGEGNTVIFIAPGAGGFVCRKTTRNCVVQPPEIDSECVSGVWPALPFDTYLKLT
jgi:hypothetical protein